MLQIVAGLAPGTWSFAAVILPIAAAAVIIDTTVGTRAQLDTDGAMRGRVLAALGMVGSASAAVGAPALGWLSDASGPGRPCTPAASRAWPRPCSRPSRWPDSPAARSAGRSPCARRWRTPDPRDRG